MTLKLRIQRGARSFRRISLCDLSVLGASVVKSLAVFSNHKRHKEDRGRTETDTGYRAAYLLICLCDLSSGP